MEPLLRTTSRFGFAWRMGTTGSRDLFVRPLKDEEEHVDWREAQVHQIKEIG